MKKLGRNTLALGMSTLLVTSAVALSANAAPGDVAQANSSAITATGLTEIVNTGVCLAESADGTPVAVEDAEGLCGTGLSLAGVTGTINQTASTDLDGNRGTSESAASVEQVTLTELPDIDLSTIDEDVLGIETGTILDGIIGAVEDPILRLALEEALAPIAGAIQDAALTPILAAVQDQLPVSVIITGFGSQCSAVAGEPAITSSVIGDIVIRVDLPNGDFISVPVTLSTDENSALVGSVAPQQLVNGLLNGLQATLNESLGGALAPLNLLLGTVQEQVVNEVFNAVGPALLDPVGEALTPILTGTVNKVERDGEAAEVTALSLNLLSDNATLDIARSACGPNGLAVVDDAAAAAGDDTPSDDTDAQADGTIADAAADAQADAIADADAQADADVTTSLPNAGAPNLLPFWLLGLGLVAFGAAVLVNERRRALI